MTRIGVKPALGGIGAARGAHRQLPAGQPFDQMQAHIDARRDAREGHDATLVDSAHAFDDIEMRKAAP